MAIESTAIDGARHVAHPLRTWFVPPRRIHGIGYQGECMIAHVRHVTYQQQSTTFGSSSAVFGLTGRGTGFVTGGGGFVDTVHRGVVSVVLEDVAGRHTNLELPAEMAILEGSAVRLDCIKGNVVAATNMSGRQERVVLLGPSAFIGHMTMTKRHVLLLIGAVMMFPQVLSPHPFVAIATTAALAALPLRRMMEIRSRTDRRKRLGHYMAEVMS